MKASRKIIRDRIHKRIRKRVSGTAERPRLAVHFSGRHVYAQVIDDLSGRTIVSASTLEKEFEGKSGKEAATTIGAAVAKRAKEKKIEAFQLCRCRLSCERHYLQW